MPCTVASGSYCPGGGWDPTGLPCPAVHSCAGGTAAPLIAVHGAPMCACASEYDGASSITLSCPGDLIGAIDFADYGYPQGSCGAWTSYGSCSSASTVLAAVQAACLLQSSCSVPAAWASPCSGGLSSVIQFRCMNASTVAQGSASYNGVCYAACNPSGGAAYIWSSMSCALCPAGSYSIPNGACSSCSPGVYGGVAGLASAACSGACDLAPGYYCGAGSTAASGTECPVGYWCGPIGGVQYIRVSVYSQFLHFNQLLAFDAGGNNVAAFKSASADCTYPCYGNAATCHDPSLAVDGSNWTTADDSRPYDTFFHSCGGYSDWWEVDLGAPMSIAALAIVNRLDCCWYR